MTRDLIPLIFSDIDPDAFWPVFLDALDYPVPKTAPPP